MGSLEIRKWKQLSYFCDDKRRLFRFGVPSSNRGGRDDLSDPTVVK